LIDKLGGNIENYICDLKFDPDRTFGKDYTGEGGDCNSMTVNILKGSKGGSMPYKVNVRRPDDQISAVRGSFWNAGQASVKKEVIYPASSDGPMHLGQNVRIHVHPLTGLPIDKPEEQTCRWQVDTATGQDVQYTSNNACDAIFSIRPKSIIWRMVLKEGFKEQLTWVTIVDKSGIKIGFTEVKYSVSR
jgi:hypothetical protein